MEQQKLSEKQFGASAGNYLTSPVHAAGADLEALVAAAAQRKPRRVLDLGCGAGHVSFALARGGVPQVTAYDPSAAMLAVVEAEAARRGYGTVEIVPGAAERLPFESGRFDWVVSRYSAHHWFDVPAALAECQRVLVSGGRLVVIDAISPEAPLLDTALQTIELLRDASHVRDYRISEWRSMLHSAGFGDVATRRWRLPMQFEAWVARIGTPPARIAALEAVIPQLPAEVRDYFQVQADHSFAIDSAWLEAVRID